jgi:hypothetical protein
MFTFYLHASKLGSMLIMVESDEIRAVLVVFGFPAILVHVASGLQFETPYRCKRKQFLSEWAHSAIRVETRTVKGHNQLLQIGTFGNGVMEVCLKRIRLDGCSDWLHRVDGMAFSWLVSHSCKRCW